MASSQATELRRVAMDFLARREHSRYELQQKLIRKFDGPDFDTHTVEPVLDRLQEDCLLSDERFAESFVRYRKSRGFGPLHIRQDLQSRRVSSEIIEAYLNSDDEDWDLLLRQVLERKQRGRAAASDPGSERQKLFRFLCSRGFAAESISRAMKYSPEPTTAKN